MLPVEVSGHVPGDDVSFEVDDRAPLVSARDGHLECVRNQGDSECACRLVYRCHCEAYTVYRDRPFDGDEPGDRGGKLDRQLAPRRCQLDGPHFACDVDVALDEMTAQQ